ncbi:hypothetical protein DICPUDRAFT_97366 [Dictyostelium purpureum]|uniref:Cation-transporting ATPase n=1 Tax=Dictyostelium purpureum TaxID=5786 RepID=F0ZG49_DICPU|nr:uncharacterized protein DICPUDRAFT_97366 [Dictyostelium purpureum]EGC37100.1 hypothetical protein DICPUDRAFT_97366 [Dictyostelium purpureum]|eukprot:XP_003286381.1 hypothetical protein DICPUDRAFT_97366 [Dictyostelium purpureum]
MIENENQIMTPPLIVDENNQENELRDLNSSYSEKESMLTSVIINDGGKQMPKKSSSPNISSSSSPFPTSPTILKSKYKESPPLLSHNSSYDSSGDSSEDESSMGHHYQSKKKSENNSLSMSPISIFGTKRNISNPMLTSLDFNTGTINQNNDNVHSGASSSNGVYIQHSNQQEQDLSYLKKVEKQENNQESSFGDDMLNVDRMIGYKKTIYGEIIYFLTILLTGGVVLLVYYWFDKLYVNLRYKKASLEKSNFVLVYSEDSRTEFCKVNYLNNDEKYIVFRYSRFFFNKHLKEFEKSKLINNYEKFELLKLIQSGLSSENYKKIFERFGKNEISFPIKNIPQLLLEEVLHPFFMFQIYSVCLWMAEEYYYYAVAIFIIATVSAVVSLREIRSNLLSLKKISYFVCDVQVLRNNQIQTISSTELVPGDIIELRQDFTMPCDVVLLTGQAILNESMLTGESIPVTKYSVLSDDEIKQFNNGQLNYQSDVKDLSKEKRSLVFGGTIVVKLMSSSSTEDRVLGMVRDTSFQTTKGKLILSILYPKKSHFKFFVESLKFVGVLCFLALIGFSLSVWRLNQLGVDGKTIVLRALDLITIVIPPALPMAMTVGTSFGLSRLKKTNIYCISPPRLNMAGKIQVFCFDKTGTLTEEGLDLLGIITTKLSFKSKNSFSPVSSPSLNSIAANTTASNNASNNSNYSFNNISYLEEGLFYNQDQQPDEENNIFKYLMASCHSLSIINGQVSGDPLEIKVFSATKSTIVDSPGSSGQSIVVPLDDCIESTETISYLENFDFQSKLQRMSVIVQLDNSGRSNSSNTTIMANNNKPSYSFVKGSPEMVKGLCVQNTIPKDYDQQLAIYTEKGYRVLACAYRHWDTTQIFSKRELLRKESESNLQFLGFIIMENKMKSQSPLIIDTLHKANIRTVMVTGDNPLTATSVAKQCGIIKKHSILFMGIVSNNPATGEEEISWEHVSREERGDIHQLDSNTLFLDGDEQMVRDYNFIITGPVFKLIYNHYLATGSIRFITMLRRGVVYSRMTPDEKQTLIEELQRIGLYVGMCGDGANDCGALKAAHVGISLSETEASIAAPFTSTITDISCCPSLIKEGRASLAVSFKLFQFMGMYSLIQFTTVIFLYFNASVLGNWMYLYQDLWVIFPLVLFMGMTKPCNKLSIKRPSGRLLSGAIVGSLLVHIAVCIAFQTCIYFLVQTKKWYNADVIDEENIFSYITTSLFIYGSFQYLIMLLTFSFGKPFLKPLYTNLFLFITYLIAFSTTILLLFVPTEAVWEFSQLLIVPISWRFTMFGILVANLVANVTVEISFYIYKIRSKKKKTINLTQIFSKDSPKDNRILENSLLIPINDNKN